MKKLFTPKIDNVLYTVSGRVKSIEYHDGDSLIIFEDDSKTNGFCCNCQELCCKQYGDDELKSVTFKSFPHNTSNRVCPTDSIYRDSLSGQIKINDKSCILCGLCLHRCPYAAIQFSVEQPYCMINHESDYKIVSNFDKQKDDVRYLKDIPRKILFKRITKKFTSSYLKTISQSSIIIPDISEIIVRNSLLNIGIICNTKAPGNNHNRIEFFGESNGKFIIGESGISNADTLEISRRILDDLAVILSRYRVEKNSIIPLAVINGLPNLRTDFYEVIQDIYNILGIKIYTITYHILFVLNLFHIRIESDFFLLFYLDKDNHDLLPAIKSILPDIDIIDHNKDSNNYSPIK